MPRKSPAATIEEIMAAAGIARSGAQARLAKHPYDREKLLAPRSAPGRSTPVHVKYGGKRLTVAEWAKELGVPEITLRVRLKKRHWTVGQALGLESPPPKPVATEKLRKLTVAGRTRTIAEWAEISGLRAELIRGRLNRGWTPADAVSNQERPMLVAAGISKSTADWERATGIKRTTVVMRIHKLGWTPEEALELVPRESRVVSRRCSDLADSKAHRQLVRELAERGIKYR